MIAALTTVVLADSFTFGGGRGYEYVDSLYFFSPSGNPATVHSSLECALMTSCVQRPLVLALRAPLFLCLTRPDCWLNRDHAVVTNQNISHIIYEDLAIRNGGADGMWFVSCSHVTVRHLDISWIGGGCLMPGPRWKDKKECTRFGNGVEFPDFVSLPTAAAVYRCLVRASWAHDPESQTRLLCAQSGPAGPTHITTSNELYANRFWEIYDAAMSPQGDGLYHQANLSFHHNVK